MGKARSPLSTPRLSPTPSIDRSPGSANTVCVTSSLADQVALVTGAGRGIGRAVALRLAGSGCRVAVLAHTGTELADTVGAAAVDPAATPLLAVPADITDDIALEHAVRVIMERLGRITVLVNSSGFAPLRETVLKTSLADWDRTLATCLRAPMVLTRLVLPDMLAHGRGTIVNVASIAAKQGRAGEAAYAAAKFGLLGFTQSLAAEVRDHGITVAAIVPRLPAIDQTASDASSDWATLRPADVADAVLNLLRNPTRDCRTEIVLDPQRDDVG